jgi:short chain dehydrogenase
MPAQYVIYQTAKAAVVTLSEAIRGELAQEGIRVSVLCPGPIRTNIHELSKTRPAKFGVGDAFRANESAGGTQVRFPSMLEPVQVGALVLDAVRNDELYIITHGEWRPAAAARHAAVIAAMPQETDPALVAMIQGRKGSCVANMRPSHHAHTVDVRDTLLVRAFHHAELDAAAREISGVSPHTEKLAARHQGQGAQGAWGINLTNMWKGFSD